MTVIRTYERFSIRWERGSEWTGYQSHAEAQAVIDHAEKVSGSTGHIERHTWEVEVRPEVAHIYLPGIAERPAS